MYRALLSGTVTALVNDAIISEYRDVLHRPKFGFNVEDIDKDSMFIELAQELTGKHDTQTVERVKHDVLSYLSKAMEQYPTREEFAREKHRYIDKEQGIIWESKMENGNMSIIAVAPCTNTTEAADSR